MYIHVDDLIFLPFCVQLMLVICPTMNFHFSLFDEIVSFWWKKLFCNYLLILLDLLLVFFGYAAKLQIPNYLLCLVRVFVDSSYLTLNQIRIKSEVGT